jgi:plastocyanin
MVVGCGAKHKERTVTLTGNSVTVTADQYFFDPSRIITKRGDLTIDFKNKGNLLHNLVLLRDGAKVAKAPSLGAGKTSTLKLKLKRGKYTLLCTVGDHEELGMKGEIDVK